MRTPCAAAAALAVALAACGGTSLPEKPQIKPDLNQLNFGADFSNAVYVGTQPSQDLQLRNAGSQDLVISEVSVTGNDAALFTAALTTDATVPSLEIAFVRVIYAPVDAGSHKATLVIVSNAENSPTLEITMNPTAIWRYQSLGHVLDTSEPPKPLKGIKVTCVKPQVAHATWSGWEVTTGDDGAFSRSHTWDCAELLAEDTAVPPVYANGVAAFGSGIDRIIRLEEVYEVSGKVVDSRSGEPLPGIRVSCNPPFFPPQSWHSWEVTTGPGGTFAKSSLWPCGSLKAEDTAKPPVYTTGSGGFTPGISVTISLTK